MRYRAAAVLLLLFACAGLRVTGSDAIGQNAWYFINPFVSLGTLTKDQAVPVKFELKNNTDRRIKIVSAEGSCRCTSLDSAPDEIPAHGIGTFQFTFNASRSEGAVTHIVTVQSGDGTTLDGTFTAFVKEPASGSPEPKPGLQN